LKPETAIGGAFIADAGYVLSSCRFSRASATATARRRRGTFSDVLVTTKTLHSPTETTEPARPQTRYPISEIDRFRGPIIIRTALVAGNFRKADHQAGTKTFFAERAAAAAYSQRASDASRK
jgi:hypothetical protein